MTHEVLLLGLARDTVGRERTTVELAADATVRDLRDGLAALHPELAAILPTCAIAIDHRYREDATALEVMKDEIAVIPPVSGG
jgi:molybdopterin converting factor small subunit